MYIYNTICTGREKRLCLSHVMTSLNRLAQVTESVAKVFGKYQRKLGECAGDLAGTTVWLECFERVFNCLYILERLNGIIKRCAQKYFHK
jgi:hypothetical protein